MKNRYKLDFPSSELEEITKIPVLFSVFQIFTLKPRRATDVCVRSRRAARGCRARSCSLQNVRDVNICKPSGKLWKITMFNGKITMFNGKINYKRT